MDPNQFHSYSIREMTVIMANLEKLVQEVLLELMVMSDNQECWVPLDPEV